MKFTWRKSLIVLSISILLLGGCSAGMNVSAEDIIHHAIEAENDINKYYATSEMKLYEGGELTDHAILEEYVAEEKRKIITKGKINHEEIEVLNDGIKMIMYDKANKEAFEMDTTGLDGLTNMSPKEQFKQVVETMKDSHTYEVVGEEKILDFDTYHIKMEAKEANSLLGNMEIWVEKETWFVVKLVSESGDIKTELEYTALDFSPKFDEDTFSINIPDDVPVESLEDSLAPDTVTLEEAEAALGKAFLVFSEEDAHLSSVQMYDFSENLDRFEVELNYQSDEGIPLFILSIFPTPEGLEIEKGDLEMRGNPAEYEEIINGYFWDEDGMRYSLLVSNPDIEQEEIMKWAENMILSSKE